MGDFIAATLPFVTPALNALGCALLGGIYWRSGALKSALLEHMKADAEFFRSFGERLLFLERHRNKNHG